MNWMNLLIVGAGGFIGAIVRYLTSSKMNNPEKAVPMGTLLVNLSGAFLLGLLIGAGADTFLHLLLGAGFLGALTTFSTLKLELGALWRDGNRRAFFLYAGLTYVLGITLAFLGVVCGSHLEILQL